MNNLLINGIVLNRYIQEISANMQCALNLWDLNALIVNLSAFKGMPKGKVMSEDVDKSDPLYTESTGNFFPRLGARENPS